MTSFVEITCLALAQLVAVVDAVPASPAPHPMVTASPALQYPTRTTVGRRDLLGSIESGVGSVLSGLGSAIPSYVASGVLTAR